MIALLNRGDVQWHPLQGDVASGPGWASPCQNVGCLVAQGLPPPPEGQASQGWLLRGSERASGGVFQPRDGSGWALVLAYARRWQIELVWRYSKSELAMESPRVWEWHVRKKLLLLATLVDAFVLHSSFDELRALDRASSPLWPL